MPETGREISGLRVLIVVALLFIAGGVYRYYRPMSVQVHKPDGALGATVLPEARFDQAKAGRESKDALAGRGERDQGESTRSAPGASLGSQDPRPSIDGLEDSHKASNSAPLGKSAHLNTPQIVVHVVGAVAHPGIYTLREGQRVADAVAVAGGATKEARLDLTNLAARLQDGQKVYIPSENDAKKTPNLSAWADTPWGQGGAGAAGTPPNVGSSKPGKVNINQARLEDLDALPGIGPALAKRIIDYRQKHGPFRRIEDLQQVPGIGPAKFQELRDLVVLN